MTSKKYVVITRPLEESSVLQNELEKLGLNTLIYPSITIQKQTIDSRAKKYLQNLESFDWIIFTSRNGVRFFMDILQTLSVDPSVLHKKYIAAVGPKTAEEVRKYGLPVHFIPSEFTTEDLAHELQNIQSKKILLPRANIATDTLLKILEKKGAIVTNIAIYNTEFVRKPNEKFKELLKNKQIQAITFTSPSTVRGFIENIKDIKNDADILTLPVLAIGPVTARSLKNEGFVKICTADIYTIEGIVAKLKESIL